MLVQQLLKTEKIPLKVIIRQQMPISYDHAQLGCKLFLSSCGQRLREPKQFLELF